MLASVILGEMKPQEKYSICSEKEFFSLALCSQTLERPFCTFVDSDKYIHDIAENATMIITTSNIAAALDEERYGIIVTDNPRLFFFSLHNYLSNCEEYVRKSFKSVVSENAVISSMTYISDENVVIEDGVIIEPFVTIYSNVILKKNTIIRSGARIGGEGFEYKRKTDGIMPVKHLGGVIIEENVEVQNNSCVDKAVYPWDDTILCKNVKVDNLVHIGHGAKVGDSTMIVANTGIGGRTIIGKECWLGFGTTIRNGISIGDKARANMGAVVTKAVKFEEAVSGNFAIEHSEFIKRLKKSGS